MSLFASRLLWLWPSLVLGTLGLTELHSWWSGKMQGLLYPTFHPFIVLSGFLLTGIALARVLVSEPVLSPQVSRAKLLQLVAGLLLLAVVIGLQKVAPTTGYSSLAFDNRGFADRAMPIMSSTYAQTMANGGISADGLQQCEVVDLLMAASDPEMVKSWDGRKVHFIGQYIPSDNGTFEVVRLLMYCCAADVQPVGIKIKGEAKNVKKLDWVEVDGITHFVPDNNTWKVDLQLTRVAPTPTPKDVYLY